MFQHLKSNTGIFLLHIVLLTFLLQLEVPHARAENQIRPVLHTVGGEIEPHFSLGAWFIQPNILAIGKEREDGTPLPTPLLIVAGPRFFWKSATPPSFFQLASVELLGGCIFTADRCVKNFDLRVIALTRYAHIFTKSGFNKNDISPSFSVEYPITWHGTNFLKVGAEYDAVYRFHDLPDDTRFGPRFSIPFGSFLSSITFRNFELHDPRLYLTYTVTF